VSTSTGPTWRADIRRSRWSTRNCRDFRSLRCR
jgi:hypothetical protein